MTKYLMFFMAIAFSGQALALVPAPQLDLNVLSVQADLESITGQALSAAQIEELQTLLQSEAFTNDITNVSNTGRRALYCVGYNRAAFVSLSEAACVELGTRKVYSIKTLGVGYNVNLSLQVFRLVFSWDASRYDAQFDIVPGKYGFATRGHAFGMGNAYFTGDAGNKEIAGVGLNLGLGFDYLTGLLLYIEAVN